jgi:hypothetical protein
MQCTVRLYSPNDRQAVRHICCETGFSGNPIDSLFCDREVFADFFTRYYTDYEPENSLVAVGNGVVVGYLNGCVRYCRYPVVQAAILGLFVVPKALVRLATFKYNQQSLHFVRWFLFKSLIETPDRPSRGAHFHINLLPPWRTGKAARKLIFSFLDSLPRRGIRRVYGQIQTFENRRTSKVFERYGFSLFDRRRVSKFNAFEKKPVYVSTFVKEM